MSKKEPIAASNEVLRGDSTRTFDDSLRVEVTLSAGERSSKVTGGQVKALELELHSHGHEGQVTFWCEAEGDADTCWSMMISSELLEVEVRVSKARYDVNPAPDPIVVQGVVVERRLREVPSAHAKGKSVLLREYVIAFCDAARALWTEHYPTCVYSQVKLEKVFKEHTSPKIRVDLGWSALGTTRALVCLGLGDDDASFYDFTFWLADREYGHVWYDYSTQKLVFADSKPALQPSVELGLETLRSTQSIQVVFPRWNRAAIHLVNSRDGATKQLPVKQPTAVDGVRRDYLIHTPIEARAEARQRLEERRCAPGMYDVLVHCDEYPQRYLVPGCTVTLAEDFSDALFVSKTTFRVVRLKIQALATHREPEFDLENDETEYTTSVTMALEPLDDPRWRGPNYVSPHYPIEMEGKVLSAVGDAGDRTYSVLEADNAVGVYQVNFANWNSTVTIPVTPDFMPGHLYFPVIKDSRVFVSLTFDSARISRFLDWGTDVTLPNASQGNHLLLGRNQKSETSIMHSYVDGAPQLVIGRVNSGDQGTVTVKEGLLVLELTDTEAASRLTATVSVEPEAQMAKADAQQKSELAVQELQGASDAAAEELTGSAVAAAATLQKQATALRVEVETKAKQVDAALEGIDQGISQQVQEVNAALNEARAQLDDLLK